MIIRARTRIEEVRGGRTAIIVSEIPYQVNKATMIERIAELARDKRIEGIAHVQDESDRFGVRVVVELRRDATPDVVLNQLFRFTPLQTSFGCNMLALNGGRPEQLDLKRFLTAFIAFREEVVARRTAFELRRARERAHVLCGLAVAVSNVDEVVATIRASADPAEARERLMTRAWPAARHRPLHLADRRPQPPGPRGRHLLPLRDPGPRHPRAAPAAADGARGQGGHRRAAGRSRRQDHRLSRHPALARPDHGDHRRRAARGEATLFAVPRRSEVIDWDADLDDEDLIEREDMAVTVTAGGYIKRTPLTEYRSQRRGGKGTQGMATKDEDFVTRLFVANTHTALLVFTTEGMVYTLKTWRLPLAGRNARGKAIVNILPIPPGVSLAAILPVDVPEAEWASLQIVFATSDGDVRRNALDDFTNVMRNGKIAMKLPEGTRLINACIASEDDDVMLTTRDGRAIRFPATDVRVFKGRDSTGVRGIRLAEGDEVVSMAIIRHFEATSDERAAYLKMRRAVAGAPEEEETEVEEGEEATRRSDSFELGQARYVAMSEAEDLLLTVTANGAGKLSSSHDYPVRGRGGQGVAAMDRAMRGGPLVALFAGRARRPGHARHRRRPVDPGAGLRHLVPLAQRRRRARLLHRRRRARRLGGAGRGERRRRRRRGLAASGKQSVHRSGLCLQSQMNYLPWCRRSGCAPSSGDTTMTNTSSAGALVARVLLAFMFILAGWAKLGDIQGAMAYTASGGLPGFFVFPAIAVELLGGLAILVGWQTRWAALTLAGFAVIAGILYHYIPALGLDGYDRVAQITNFQKNLAIAGGFLALASFGPGRFSLDERPDRFAHA